MKKKLVAFAVTAAMIVTSAVPAFAVDWDVEKPSEPVAPVEDPNPNVVTVKAGSDLDTYAEMGELTDTAKHFTQIIDLNKYLTKGDAHNIHLYFSKGEKGETADGVTLTLEQTYKTVWRAYASKTGAAEKTLVAGDLYGIVEVDWAVSKAGVTITINQLGKKAPQVGTATFELNKDIDWVQNLVADAGKNDLVMYNEYPEYIEAVSVQEEVLDEKGNVVKDKDGNTVYEDAGQPAVGDKLCITGMTLTADTKIAAEDITTYADIHWYRDNEEITEAANKLEYTVNDTTDKGHKIIVKVLAKKGTGVFDGVVWGDDFDALARFDRLAGADRYETAMAIANKMKPTGGFKSIIVASGTDFADALSGTALASKLAQTVGNTPILLVNSGSEDAVVDYINENAAGYTTDIYILGGENAVAASFAEKVKKYDVTRLAGADRYATNIEILKQVVNPAEQTAMLVASGMDYADALSASATGYPVLLVGKTLTKVQKDYLKTLESNDAYHIIGGTNAVSKNVENTLKSKDYVQAPNANVARIAGANRFETSYEVYDYFKDYVFKTATSAVIASGNDYPDGLAAAAYAYLNKAPLLLVNGDNTGYANKIVNAMAEKLGKYNIWVAGGENAVSNEAVQKIAAKVDAPKVA